MFPLLMPLLIGAGLGAVANKKDPLKGALLGAGLGAAGGTLAAGGGGLLGGSSAAAGAGATTAGGLLAPGASAAAGAAEMASTLPAFNPISGAYVNATSLPGMTGVTESLKAATTAMKPVGEAMGTAKLAQGLLAEPEMAPPPPMPIQSQPLDLSGVLNSNQQEMVRTFEEDMKRRQSMGEFARYAMGAR